mgnify:FL=1
MTISTIYSPKRLENTKIDQLTTLERKNLLDIIRRNSPEYWSKFKSCISWNDAKVVLEHFIAQNQKFSEDFERRQP